MSQRNDLQDFQKLRILAAIGEGDHRPGKLYMKTSITYTRLNNLLNEMVKQGLILKIPKKSQNVVYSSFQLSEEGKSVVESYRSIRVELRRNLNG